MRKVLINVPDFRNKGGVAQYYIVMNFISESNIEYFNINNFGKNALLRLLKTYKLFNKKILDYNVIVLNPSLDKKSFFRDFFFMWLALRKNKKIIVFWHGWSNRFEKKIKSDFVLKKIFRSTFGKASVTIVLSKIFKDKLIELGVTSEFYVETMPVSKEWIDEFDIKEKKLTEQTNIVFLSRIVKEKGVFTCVDTIKLITETNRNVFLHIAGDGKDLNNLKAYVEKNKIKNIIFYGDVRGKTKTEVLSNGNIFFFPTEYGEGFPNVIIEAMFFGLPVISRFVAAIPEIIEQEKTGYLTDSTNPNVYEAIIKNYIALSNQEKMQMAINCHNESKEKYSILKIKERVLNIFQKYNYE
jgi:glycosyltransferase involved in cell wall biosynthesis